LIDAQRSEVRKLASVLALALAAAIFACAAAGFAAYAILVALGEEHACRSALIEAALHCCRASRCCWPEASPGLDARLAFD